MYRQILVNKRQTPLQRILWRENPANSIEVYELLTLTYGTASASFVATKVIQQLADLKAHLFPEEAAVARREIYVDDFLTGANNKTRILEIRDQLISRLNKGGFKIRKWVSNDKEILQDIASKGQLLELDKDGFGKALGISWNPVKDTFQYRISVRISSSVHTKRSILSQISQIFESIRTFRLSHHNCKNYDLATLEDANKLGRNIAHGSSIKMIALHQGLTKLRRNRNTTKNYER